MLTTSIGNFSHVSSLSPILVLISFSFRRFFGCTTDSTFAILSWFAVHIELKFAPTANRSGLKVKRVKQVKAEPLRIGECSITHTGMLTDAQESLMFPLCVARKVEHSGARPCRIRNFFFFFCDNIPYRERAVVRRRGVGGDG